MAKKTSVAGHAERMEKRYAMIASEVNPDTGEVTLYISNEKWGPIVTGKNLAEAKAKFIEAFGVSLIAKSYLALKKAEKAGEDGTLLKKRVEEYREELCRIENTFEKSL